MGRQVCIVNVTRNLSLGEHIEVAHTAVARAIGLLGHRCLEQGSGLLIDPSSGIHTFGMRFAIDVIALDRDLRVRGLWQNLPAFRMAGLHWRTRCVLELPAGSIRASGTAIGDQLAVRHQPAH